MGALPYMSPQVNPPYAVQQLPVKCQNIKENKSQPPTLPCVSFSVGIFLSTCSRLIIG